MKNISFIDQLFQTFKFTRKKRKMFFVGDNTRHRETAPQISQNFPKKTL